MTCRPSHFTLLHEIGHIFDYQKKFTAALPWVPVDDFQLRSQICLNNCKGKYLSEKQTTTLYREIFKHGFVSQLAATNAMEDFAESFAMFVAARDMNLHFTVVADDGAIFRADDVLKSEKFKEKSEFLKAHF